jgi:hypothetical protein
MAGRVSIPGPTVAALAVAIVVGLAGGGVRTVAQTNKPASGSTASVSAGSVGVASGQGAERAAPAAAHDKRYKRLLIRNAMVSTATRSRRMGPWTSSSRTG